MKYLFNILLAILTYTAEAIYWFLIGLMSTFIFIGHVFWHFKFPKKPFLHLNEWFNHQADSNGIGIKSMRVITGCTFMVILSFFLLFLYFFIPTLLILFGLIAIIISIAFIAS